MLKIFLKSLYGLIFISCLTFSQDLKINCDLQKSYYKELFAVTANDLKCIAKNSGKSNVVFFTFASWCEPCLYHLPNFFALKEKYDVDLYVLLVDKEDDSRNDRSKEYVWEVNKEAKILVIKDIESKGRKKKYKNFLDEITPSQFENIDDMSKFIVFDNKGIVQLVTNYKDDNKDNSNWKDNGPMMRRIILPLLKKKESQTQE